MKRRDFLQKSISAGLIAGASLKLAGINSLFANSLDPLDNDYDLVAIKGGEADAMFDKAISEFGGMKKFVKPNQTVVLKPNIGWDVIPENAANTNPKLVSRIIKHCFDAGAKEVYVFDHTCDEWTRCYSNSGIEKAVKDAGGTIVPGHSESYYQTVEIKNGESLKTAKVHELIMESDVFINVPVLKSHGGARVTISMKNLMGVVWDRGYWHRNDLHQCIADYVPFRKPDLNIVDAYAVMKRNGPRGVSKSDVVQMKSQIISTDIVAADAAAAKLFGFEPENVEYIRLAGEANYGQMDLSKLNISRLSI